MWVAFSTLSWNLWVIRKKALSEEFFFNSPTYDSKKWVLLSRRSDWDSTSSLIGKVKAKMAELRAEIN
jgi:hypothetical protein